MRETAVPRTGSSEQGLEEEELLISTLEKPSLVESPCANALKSENKIQGADLSK